MFIAGRIPLEDTWFDVLCKARRGLGLSDGSLSELSGLTAQEVSGLMEGVFDGQKLTRLAAALQLDPSRLLLMARGGYHPGELSLPRGMAMFTTPWSDFEVHSYLAWDPVSREAVAFDTGSDASEMLSCLAEQDLSLKLVLLTHGHGDHVFDLDRLTEKTGAVVWIGDGEDVGGVRTFRPGREFSVGSLRIETRSTWGHAKGGITYIIHGLPSPIAVVGDALFAGSMGGANVSYKACLETNRAGILSLPPDTILCPGHGPLTTVALERTNNPFFGNPSEGLTEPLP
jgi:glyoxylase-like metal-dependent hydrolase (beta-lactamase superfamily II)